MMSAPVNTPKTGQIVYKNYTPAVVGTIIAVLSEGDDDARWPRVQVKWDNKKRGTTEETTLGLADYESLVEEHERKAKNHRATLARIQRERVREVLATTDGLSRLVQEKMGRA